MRARLLAAALGVGLLGLGRPTPARAAVDSVLVRVGGELSARQYERIDVPITVDLSGAPGRALGSYRATLSFNPALLEFTGADNGTFATPQANTSHASDSGKVVLTAIQPSGATGTVVIFNAHFYVLSDTGQSPVTIAFDEMSATATSVTPFEILLPLLRVVNGTFCRSLGHWGDANGDGQANSLDALVALSAVVGIPVDTTLVQPALTDVDADGRVTSRDALIILSYGVGLPVPGYRVLLTAAGACGTGSAVTVTITPDSLELQVGQTAFVQVDARDASGRSVSTDSGTITSSDPSIAAFVGGYGPSAVEGRAPGVATLTAQLGPGVSGKLKVVVLARRSTWYVDVERSRLAPTQTGTQAFPMEFIGEALDLAHNGDTVRVASGIYEEVIASYGGAAVAIIGDSANRPVIDPRGSPDWYTYQWAIDIAPYQGLLSLANLVVRAGKVYLDAHDVAVRNVRIEGLSGTYGYAALEVYSENLTPAVAPLAGGPMRSVVPVAPGNVLLDGVVVLADSTSSGIVVDLADSVLIQNSTVSRSVPAFSSYCYGYPGSDAGIRIDQASVSVVRNNSVTNAQCIGIGAFDQPGYFATLVSDIGHATISHNHVTGSAGPGIMAGARVSALDHNMVRQSMSDGVVAASSVNCDCTSTPLDSVTSTRDSVFGVGSSGIYVDAFYTQIDTAVVDSAAYSAIELRSARRALVRASVGRRSNTGLYAYSVDTLQVLQDTLRADTTGLYVYNAVDSVRIGGSVFDANNGAGIYLYYSVRARIDTSVATNNQTGLYIYDVAGARVRRSRFQGNNTGMWLDSYAGMPSYVDSSSFIGNVAAGARNDAYAYSLNVDTLFASNNYWNDPSGPTCDPVIVGTCPGTVGDSIATLGVIYAPVLTAPGPTPAPLALLGASIASAPPTGGRVPPKPVARPVRRSAAVAGPGVSAQSQSVRHQQATAWHAPSKARARPVQGGPKQQ